MEHRRASARLIGACVALALAACASGPRTKYVGAYDRRPSYLAAVAADAMMRASGIDQVTGSKSTILRPAFAIFASPESPLDAKSGLDVILVFYMVVDSSFVHGGTTKTEVQLIVEPKLVRDGELLPDAKLPPAAVARAAQLLDAIRRAEEPYIAPL